MLLQDTRKSQFVVSHIDLWVHLLNFVSRLFNHMPSQQNGTLSQ